MVNIVSLCVLSAYKSGIVVTLLPASLNPRRSFIEKNIERKEGETFPIFPLIILHLDGYCYN